MQKESEERIPHERLAYDAKEVATLIGCSVTTVFKMIREEKLRAKKMGGRTLILRGDLETFLANLPSV